MPIKKSYEYNEETADRSGGERRLFCDDCVFFRDLEGSTAIWIFVSRAPVGEITLYIR